MGLSIERNVYAEYAEQLETIEKLCAQPITEELHEEIIHELDVVHDNLSKCETTAAKTNLFAQSFLRELQEKAVFLYGKVDDSFHQHEIEVIKEEAESLDLTLKQRDLLRLTRMIESLKSHINHLLESYRPDMSERHVVNFAKTTLERAEALLEGRVLEMPEMDPEEIQEILEELAEYLGSNDKISLRLLMNRLSPDQKKRILSYMTDPQDLLSCLLHDVEGSAHNKQIFRGTRDTLSY